MANNGEDNSGLSEGQRKLKESGLGGVPVLGTVVRAVTGDVPNSVLDGLGMDITEALIGIVPVVGDLVIGGIRTVRYTMHDEIPDEIKAELVAISAVDTGIGIVPIVGDIADLALVTNTYSFIRMQNHKGEKVNFLKT